MGLEVSVTKISDLNASWPLNTDERSDGDDHLRNIKTALRSLLSDLNQIGIGPASLTGQAGKVLQVNVGETAYELADALTTASMARDSTYEATITGAGTAWALSATPDAGGVFLLFRNGVLQKTGTDFTRVGANITLTTSLDTANGETLEAVYFL